MAHSVNSGEHGVEAEDELESLCGKLFDSAIILRSPVTRRIQAKLDKVRAGSECGHFSYYSETFDIIYVFAVDNLTSRDESTALFECITIGAFQNLSGRLAICIGISLDESHAGITTMLIDAEIARKSPLAKEFFGNSERISSND